MTSLSATNNAQILSHFFLCFLVLRVEPMSFALSYNLNPSYFETDSCSVVTLPKRGLNLSSFCLSLQCNWYDRPVLWHPAKVSVSMTPKSQMWKVRLIKDEWLLQSGAASLCKTQLYTRSTSWASWTISKWCVTLLCLSGLLANF